MTGRTFKQSISIFIISLFARPAFFKFWQRVYYIVQKFLGIGNFDEFGDTTGENWLLDKLIKRGNISVFFDVGANHGQYSQLIKSRTPGVQVYAFEPHPKTYARLVSVAEKFDKFETVNVAVGNPNETQTSISLYDYAGNDGSQHASIHKEVFNQIYNAEVVKYDIPLISLEKFCTDRKIDRISFLKVDTEGAEIDVLRGLGSYITQSKIDFIQFEFNEMNVGRVRFLDFWNLLSDGYELSRILPKGLGRFEVYNSSATEVYSIQNYLAVRKGVKL